VGLRLLKGISFSSSFFFTIFLGKLYQRKPSVFLFAKELIEINNDIIKDKILKIIPTNKKIDFNELINLVKKNKFKIGIYPIEDKNWIDVGQWSEIKKINYGKNEIL